MSNLLNPQPVTINWLDISGECVSVIHRALGAAIQERLYCATMEFPTDDSNKFLNNYLTYTGIGAGNVFEDPLEDYGDHGGNQSWPQLKQKLNRFVKPTWLADLVSNATSAANISRWNEADLLTDCSLSEWPAFPEHDNYREQSKEKYQAIYQILKRLTLTVASDNCEVPWNRQRLGFGLSNGFFHISGVNQNDVLELWDPVGMAKFNDRTAVDGTDYRSNGFDSIRGGDFRQLTPTTPAWDDERFYVAMQFQRQSILLKDLPAGLTLSIQCASIVNPQYDLAPIAHGWVLSGTTATAQNTVGDVEDIRITFDEIENITIADMTLEESDPAYDHPQQKNFDTNVYAVIDWQSSLIHKAPV